MSMNKNRRLTVEKQQKVYQDWLLKTFPALFNEKFLPMPIGIFEQLCDCLPANISRTDLRATLGWYASRIKYLNNVCSLEHRLNLDGTVASVISSAEKAAAVKKIKEIVQAKKALASKKSKVA